VIGKRAVALVSSLSWEAQLELRKSSNHLQLAHLEHVCELVAAGAAGGAGGGGGGQKR